MKLDDTVFVKEPYISHTWQSLEGEIVHISYEKNSDKPEVYLVSFNDSGLTQWFHCNALKLVN